MSLREAVRLMREELRRRWTLSPSGRYAVPSPMGMLSPKGMLSHKGMIWMRRSMSTAGGRIETISDVRKLKTIIIIETLMNY